MAALTQSGIPGVGLGVEGYYGSELVPNQYFDYHHTGADTVDKIDIQDFRQCIGAVASLIYVIADMDEMLPRA